MSKKAKEAAALEAQLRQAAEDAKRLFTLHDRDRHFAETTTKTGNDFEHFDRTREEERLKKERANYVKISEMLSRNRQLMLREHNKHEVWRHIEEFSWLPSVGSEAEISSFLSAWRDDMENCVAMVPRPETTVLIHTVPAHGKDAHDTARTVEKLHLMRVDAAPKADARKTLVDDNMKMCIEAVRLTEAIWCEHDVASVKDQREVLAFHERHLSALFGQVLSTIDKMTCVVLQYLDVFVIEEAEDMYQRSIPNRDPNPTIKFGVFTKTDKTRGGAAIKYADLGISIEPADARNPRQFKTLTMGKEGASMRVVQLNFDPYGVSLARDKGHCFYALDCVFIVESLQAPERKKPVGEFSYRTEADNPEELARNVYPPPELRDAQEAQLKLSFEVPETIVMRQRNPIIGKWLPEEGRWEETSLAKFSSDSELRKLSFKSKELTTLAVILPKGYDVPYDHWHLYPLSEDEVVFLLEGKHHEDDGTTAEIRIHVKESLCRLAAPDDKELGHLRDKWMPAATLLRQLAKAGYNLLLDDKDAEFTEGILPRTRELETKAYFDMSLFCTLHAFASSKHNRKCEDKNVALFRMSKQQRPRGHEEPFTVEETSEMHGIRYEKNRCVISQFNETELQPTLSNVAGKDTHLNLYTLLSTEYQSDEVESRCQANALLQDAVLHLLLLVRPFTWG